MNKAGTDLTDIDPQIKSKEPSRKMTRIFSHGFTVLASLLLLVSLKLPLWQMRLEAPQYREQEALHISVHPDALRGDLRELTTLDQYIGVHVPPTLPQFRWLPVLLIAGALLGATSCALRGALRPRVLAFVSCALAMGLAAAAVQAMFQIHDIGHKRDQKTVLRGVKDFTPPFLGTSRIAQFTVSSRLGFGAWLIGGALALQVGAGWLSRRPGVRRENPSVSEPGEVAPLEPVHSH